jgi:hypothetical protein
MVIDWAQRHLDKQEPIMLPQEKAWERAISEMQAINKYMMENFAISDPPGR